MSRYNKRTIAVNKNEMYENIFEQRDVKNISQYTTPILKYPNEKNKIQIRTVDHTWNQGDKFWRLASTHYGDPNLWWVIAQFNQKPTEGHLEPGDIIEIPVDLAVILGAIN